MQINAQYATPGTGVNWTMDDLVTNSQGVVIWNWEDQYEILQDLTISAGDTLSFYTATTVIPHEDVLITVNGILRTLTALQDEVIFTGQNNGSVYYKGFRFENTSGTTLTRTFFYGAGGIKMVNAGAEFTDCWFEGFDQGNCTGTVDLFQSDPVFTGCSFIYNAGPAVSSAANGVSSPQLFGCYLFGNVKANVNMPQINLGTSGNDSIRIVNCSVIGDAGLEQVGGIALATLAGGEIKCRIENCGIVQNRYGIVQYGNDIGSLIKNNVIEGNNTQGAPMLGGSGINFFGGQTNQSIVTGNKITGNLWGITIQNTAKPDLGDLQSGISPGLNQIYNNGNEGVVYDLYNNTPNDIMAENNYWGTMDPDTVEMHIVHQPDDPTLGFVDYLPLWDVYTGTENKIREKDEALIVELYPNPANDHLFVKTTGMDVSGQPTMIRLTGLSGENLFSTRIFTGTLKIPVAHLRQGLYLLHVRQGSAAEVRKVIISH